MVKSQNLADFLIQICGIVAVPLLTETTEIIEILPDLGSRHFHDTAEFLRRDPLFSGIF